MPYCRRCADAAKAVQQSTDLTMRQAASTPEIDGAGLPVTVVARRRERFAAYRKALRDVGVVATFGVFPLVLIIVVLYGQVRSGHAAVTVESVVSHGFAMDFHGQYWPAGRRVLDGLSPYDLGWQDIQHEIAFPYGAVAALLFVPFALLPLGLAEVVFTGLCFAAVPLTLGLLGVRDWRVYGLVFLWPPVTLGWVTANVSLLLGVGIAVLWRHRDRAFVVGLLVALLVSIKLFVWPLAIFLLGSRRYVALGYVVLCGLGLNLVAWAVLGFDQIGPYVKLLGLVSDREEPRSYSLLAVALDHGATQSAAYALVLGLAAVVGSACFVLARRGREEAALLLSIATGLLATPVTWPHYFALLIVPLALLRPRLSPIWVVPVAMTPVASMMSVFDERMAGGLAVIAAVIVGALRPVTLGAPAISTSERLPVRTA